MSEKKHCQHYLKYLRIMMEYVELPDLVLIVDQYALDWFEWHIVEKLPSDVGRLTCPILTSPFVLARDEKKRHTVFLSNSYSLGKHSELSWRFRAQNLIKKNNDFGLFIGLYDHLSTHHGISFLFHNDYEMYVNGKLYMWWPHIRRDEKDDWWIHFHYLPNPKQNQFEFKVAFAPESDIKQVDSQRWKDVVPFLISTEWDLETFSKMHPVVLISSHTDKLVLNFEKSI